MWARFAQRGTSVPSRSGGPACPNRATTAARDAEFSNNFAMNFPPLFIYALALLGFVCTNLILARVAGPKKKTVVKEMPYESGMVPIGEGTRRMPIRFYLVAVLFILFDIEVIFFLPWAIVLRDFAGIGRGGFILIEMVIFIVILLVGYVYAWKKGALEWE